MADIAVACPNCERSLHLPESYFGETVQCPHCSHSFKANRPNSGVQSSPPPPPRPEGESTEIARRSSESRRDEEDDEEDDEEFARPRRRDLDLMPHRGSMIFTLGILSIFLMPLVLGTIAWFLGDADLKAMEEGRMDPAGKEQTRTGRTIGKVMVIVNLCVLAVMLIGMCVFLAVILSVGLVR